MCGVLGTLEVTFLRIPYFHCKLSEDFLLMAAQLSSDLPRQKLVSLPNLSFVQPTESGERGRKCEKRKREKGAHCEKPLQL